MASKVTINVPGGIGQSFLREWCYAGGRKIITITRLGGNDSVEYDDTELDANDISVLQSIITAHDPGTVASFSGDDSKEANFIEDETGRLTRMSPGNRRDEDLEELINTIEELGPEGLTDQFLGG